MNQLNSIILEGNLKGKPKVLKEGDRRNGLSFKIGVERYTKDREGNPVQSVSVFEIRAFGILGETCYNNLKPKRGVRIVGRLARDNSKVYVLAEHVEFKVYFKK